jgi:hypothetical protein
MATVAEIEQEIAAIKANLGQLQAAKSAAEREFAALEAQKDEIVSAARKQARGGDQAGAKTLFAQADQLDAKMQQLLTSPAYENLDKAESKLRTLESDLYGAKQKEEFDAKQNQTSTAAAAVATSGEGATQHPPAPPETATGRVTPTQAATLAGGTPAADSGTDAPTKTLAQTQSVPAQPAQQTNTNRETPTAGGEPGVGAASDDRSGTRSTTKLIIDKFSGTVKPQPNVLDQYASYTYSISWYLLAPETYGKVLNSRTQRPNLAGDQLLMQSGGAPVSGNTPGSVGRNAYFPNDYYLDNLEIKSVMLGSGSRAAHNSTEIKFVVTEPNGITLYENLYQAVKEVYNEVNLPYSQAQFCLVIRFYGYDAQGNLVAAHAPNTSVTDRSAVVEKFFPFKIKNIKFRITTTRLVEYSVEAVCIPYDVGMSTNRGTINSSMELAGLTVLDLLEGTGVSTAEPAPEDTGRLTTATPPTSPPPPPVLVKDLPMKEQAAIAAGTDVNLINDDGAALPI